MPQGFKQFSRRMAGSRGQRCCRIICASVLVPTPKRHVWTALTAYDSLDAYIPGAGGILHALVAYGKITLCHFTPWLCQYLQQCSAQSLGTPDVPTRLFAGLVQNKCLERFPRGCVLKQARTSSTLSSELDLSQVSHIYMNNDTSRICHLFS